MDKTTIIQIGYGLGAVLATLGGYVLYRWKQVRRVRFEMENADGTKIIAAIEKPPLYQIPPQTQAKPPPPEVVNAPS